ncbi:DNA-binding response regulator [Cohnella silvisoli]|uniref:DNA-binding response regulator n=1 Tax=Cohnella silvisoli TaxID=2873699 RepID=A0ABV1L1N0_9BACL|nr:DNA-binding response regulator [Cohnella silvisoli]MCD9025912.1 DNA-binding response regulator [Cohnella silvisoli]
MKSKEKVMISVEFEKAYETWMANQIKISKGERKRRLVELSNHAEKMFALQVWWPSFGNFTGLHPEFEIRDFKDGWRYLDFAYISEGLRICIEIDSYGTHWRDVNRDQFSDHLMRQNHLVIDGWLVLRFSYDNIVDKPRQCQQILQQLLGRWRGTSNLSRLALTPTEKTIYDLGCARTEPLTPTITASTLGMHRKTAAKHLRILVEKGLMQPIETSSSRVVRYKVKPNRFSKE